MVGGGHRRTAGHLGQRDRIHVDAARANLNRLHQRCKPAGRDQTRQSLGGATQRRPSAEGHCPSAGQGYEPYLHCGWATPSSWRSLLLLTHFAKARAADGCCSSLQASSAIASEKPLPISCARCVLGEVALVRSIRLPMSLMSLMSLSGSAKRPLRSNSAA